VPSEYYPADGLSCAGAPPTSSPSAYDGTGGGGLYQGPVGLFSKARLRALAGITGTAATPAQLGHACAVLGKQRRALAAGDLRAYGETLAGGFFHQGDTAANGTVLLPPNRELLYLDPRRDEELGDHSRFFRDSYVSTAMGRRVQFNVYLPKGYTRTTAKRYPVVYMLNGFNGSNIEWEARDMDALLDKLTADGHREKHAIARCAAGLAGAGRAVGILAGTTTALLAAELLDLPGLTVVTNSIRIADVFHDDARPDRPVVLIGGTRTASDALVGPVAQHTAAGINLDLLFLGVRGMTVRAGFTTADLAEAQTHGMLVRAARRVVVLADHTKWGVAGVARIAPLAGADVLASERAWAGPPAPPCASTSVSSDWRLRPDRLARVGGRARVAGRVQAAGGPGSTGSPGSAGVAGSPHQSAEPSWGWPLSRDWRSRASI
jgi:DeoR/GlpR family transcriptional regulator of sugar metabolism